MPRVGRYPGRYPDGRYPDGRYPSYDITLEMGEPYHAVTGEDLTLPRLRLLNLLDTSHTQTAQALLNLAANYSIGRTPTYHTITSDNLTLASLRLLEVAGTYHDLTADTPAVDILNTLNVQDPGHTIATCSAANVGNLLLESGGAFLLEDDENLLLDRGCDAISLTAIRGLTTQDANHTVTGDVLTLEGLLTLPSTKDTAHTLTVDALVLVSSAVLAVRDTYHDFRSDPLWISDGPITNVVDNVYHDLTGEKIDPTAVRVLTTRDTYHTLTVNHLTTGASAKLAPKAPYHTLTTALPLLHRLRQMSLVNTYHTVTTDQPLVSAAQATTTPQEAYHTHNPHQLISRASDDATADNTGDWTETFDTFTHNADHYEGVTNNFSETCYLSAPLTQDKTYVITMQIKKAVGDGVVSVTAQTDGGDTAPAYALTLTTSYQTWTSVLTYTGASGDVNIGFRTSAPLSVTVSFKTFDVSEWSPDIALVAVRGPVVQNPYHTLTGENIDTKTGEVLQTRNPYHTVTGAIARIDAATGVAVQNPYHTVTGDFLQVTSGVREGTDIVTPNAVYNIIANARVYPLTPAKERVYNLSVDPDSD